MPAYGTNEIRTFFFGHYHYGNQGSSVPKHWMLQNEKLLKYTEEFGISNLQVINFHKKCQGALCHCHVGLFNNWLATCVC